MAKVSDQDIRDAFDHREDVGKLELTASELADILTEHFLPEGESITRQAVDARLNNKNGGVEGIAEVTHGRQKQYHMTKDGELLFADGGAWLRAYQSYIRFLTPHEAISTFGLHAIVGALVAAVYAIIGSVAWGYPVGVLETAVFGALVALAVVFAGYAVEITGGFIEGVRESRKS